MLKISVFNLGFPDVKNNKSLKKFFIFTKENIEFVKIFQKH